jgi:DNA segregation ATPase FtsK/SpoIIIE, S-DNA-T family
MFWKRKPYTNVIRKAFLAGKIYVERTRGQGDSAKTLRQLPKILDVVEDRGNITIKFDIPVEVNPDKVHDNLWVFENVFNGIASAENEFTHFTVKIFSEGLPDEVAFPQHIPALTKLSVPILCGKDSEDWVYYDMVDAPNLCLAGVPGSGKSNQLTSILTTICLHKTPQEVELYLADLKGSEFHTFEDVPHVKMNCSTIAELSDVISELKDEREIRAQLLTEYKVKHIMHLPDNVRVPYIIFAIDEVKMISSDKENKELMKEIHKLTNIGRSLGIYFIFSMQRPDSNVLDGDMKNNLTVRMAFRHADQINYRITLGEEGAPKEINVSQKGRFWFKGEGMSLLQAPYLACEYEYDQARELLRPLFEKQTQHEEVSSGWELL